MAPFFKKFFSLSKWFGPIQHMNSIFVCTWHSANKLIVILVPVLCMYSGCPAVAVLFLHYTLSLVASVTNTNHCVTLLCMYSGYPVVALAMVAVLVLHYSLSLVASVTNTNHCVLVVRSAHSTNTGVAQGHIIYFPSLHAITDVYTYMNQ